MKDTVTGNHKSTLREHAPEAGAVATYGRPLTRNTRSRYRRNLLPCGALLTVGDRLPNARRLARIRVSKDAHARCVCLDSRRRAS